MARAAQWIRARGGIPATRVFTRIWLAMFGEWSWDDLPVMPPEPIYLPAWFPLNVYDWAYWARQTLVPLTIVGTLRPVRPLPFTLNELAGPGAGPGDPPRRIGRTDRPGPGPGWAALFGALDRGLHGYERRAHGAAPVRAVRGAAVRGMDHRAAGEGRLLGRHPAALGLLADRPASARLRARPPGDQARAGRAGAVHHHRGHAGRPGAAAGSLPVTGVGHRAGRRRAGRRGPAARSCRAHLRGRLGAR